MKLYFTAVLLLIGTITDAQNAYLTIVQGDRVQDQVSYPPGSTFAVYNTNQDQLFNTLNAPKTFTINQPLTLIVNPTYKSTADTLALSSGSLIYSNAPRYGTHSKLTVIGHNSHGVTVNKTLTNSENFYGLNNVVLEFSNGVIFTYNDQTVFATLNGKSLKIEGKYLIYSNLGVHKVSFNPHTGKVYWVFEPAN